MSMDYFRAEHLAVGYGKEPLIASIDFSLPRGKILTLIGPNGAGKSTILKTITGQLERMGGRLFLNEKPLDEIRQHELAKKMAMVLTERPHPELMTCEEMVETGRYPYTGKLGILSDADHEKVRAALLRVRAEDIAEQSFDKISDGQRQRIMLARALCQEPELLILDEPTSFLDIRHKLEILSILKKMVQNERLTVIMSLHELDLAQRISDYVMCVNHRRIEAFGTPEEIFQTDEIEALYEVTEGSYNAAFGFLEMEAVRGAPEVFVIGGNGSAVTLFRKLQRGGIPFAAGILHKNDIDCMAAQALAAEVFTEEAFREITKEHFDEAAACMLRCRRVICTTEKFEGINQRNRELCLLAQEKGLLVPGSGDGEER